MRLRTELTLAGVLLVTGAPALAGEYEATGYASWYGEELKGNRTASGEMFDPQGVSAAHRSLPLPSYVEVTSLDTGRTILVRVNDRGPYHSNRLIDLSMGAARQLGLMGHGARLVHIRAVEPSDAEKRALQRGQPVAVRMSMSQTELDQLRDASRWVAPRTIRATMPAGGGPYWILVATFSSRARAESLAETLDGEVAAANGLYRVRIGPYRDAASVNAALAPLAARGYPDVRISR